MTLNLRLPQEGCATPGTDRGLMGQVLKTGLRVSEAARIPTETRPARLDDVVPSEHVSSMWIST